MATSSLFLQDQQLKSSSSTSKTIECILCDSLIELRHIPLKNEIDALKRHLLNEHKFVIADVCEVPNLRKYLQYWRKRLQHIKSLAEVCTLIKTNSGENDTAKSEEYFMLCPDVLKEDKELREELAKNALRVALECQELERTDDSFARQCIFCRKEFSGNIRTLFSHLLEGHNFNLGSIENIVYGGELLDLLETKLQKRLCLYCENVFTDWDTLKNHMRKKHHKRIHPHNSEYDKYFVINYAADKHLVQKKIDEIDDEENEDDNWEDWEENCANNLVCLFCKHISRDMNSFEQHLVKQHVFDFAVLQKLPFYHKVKLLNYIRRQVHNFTCHMCEEKFSSSIELNEHLMTSKHNTGIPEDRLWNLTEFYFSTFEDDEVLINLQDNDKDEKNNIYDSVTILPE